MVDPLHQRVVTDHQTQPLSRSRRRVILTICCMSILIVSLDNTVVNVALPSIRRDLDASVSQLQWIVDSYTLVLASLLIAAGSVADRLGRARIFSVGLVVFAGGSLLCSAAPSPNALLVFPTGQGAGGSVPQPGAT